MLKWRGTLHSVVPAGSTVARVRHWAKRWGSGYLALFVSTCEPRRFGLRVQQNENYRKRGFRNFNGTRFSKNGPRLFFCFLAIQIIPDLRAACSPNARKGAGRIGRGKGDGVRDFLVLQGENIKKGSKRYQNEPILENNKITKLKF